LTPFDTVGAFRFTVDSGGVRKLAARGGGVTVFSSALGLAIQIVSTVVLARLLTPADFGLVAMVTTFSLLLSNFGLNGFTEAVIQREVIDHRLVSNIFWINLSAGLILTVGFAASGSLLALFYGNPNVARVAVGMSLTILLTSTSVLHLALLKRAMRFSLVCTNDIVARIVLVAVSILLGCEGWGYRALVAGAVAQAFIQAAGAWYLCRWIPGRPQRLAGTSSMVRFAMNTYGRFTVNYGARNLDNLLVGWRFDAQSLGFYKKAYDLFALSASQLISPLSNVAVAVLSRLNHDAPRYRTYFLSALSLMAFVGMGLSGGLTLVGQDVIRILLGPGWEPAGRIFTFFGPGIGVMLLYGMHGWVHLSIGRADRWFRWGIVEFAVTGLLFILGLQWGPAGVAVAWTASFWMLLLPAFWYAGKPIRLGIAPVIAAIWRYALASLLAGCVSVAITRGLPYFGASGALGAVIRVLKISGVFGVLYLGAVVLFHRGWGPLALVFQLASEMTSGGRDSLLPAVSIATPDTLASACRPHDGSI
jgi:PST family polysaccharide transporter